MAGRRRRRCMCNVCLSAPHAAVGHGRGPSPKAHGGLLHLPCKFGRVGRSHVHVHRNFGACCAAALPSTALLFFEQQSFECVVPKQERSSAIAAHIERTSQPGQQRLARHHCAVLCCASWMQPSTPPQ